MAKPHVDDERLAVLASSGDAHALAELLRRTLPMVRRLVSAYPFTAADKADATQDVMMQIVRKIQTFRGDARFSTWVYRVTANTCLMRLRETTARRESACGDDLPRATSSAPSAERMLLEDEERRSLTDAIDKLLPEHRVLLAMHYFEDAPLEAIAAARRTTEASVRSGLYRARIALRRALDA